jgi:hypothetical protein
MPVQLYLVYIYVFGNEVEMPWMLWMPMAKA